MSLTPLLTIRGAGGIALGGIALLSVLQRLIRPRQPRWGATADEMTRTLPDDADAPKHSLDATRAVTVADRAIPPDMGAKGDSWADGRLSMPRRVIGVAGPMIGPRRAT